MEGAESVDVGVVEEGAFGLGGRARLLGKGPLQYVMRLGQPLDLESLILLGKHHRRLAQNENLLSILHIDPGILDSSSGPFLRQSVSLVRICTTRVGLGNLLKSVSGTTCAPIWMFDLTLIEAFDEAAKIGVRVLNVIDVLIYVEKPIVLVYRLLSNRDLRRSLFV